MTMTLIETVTLTSAASSIEFTSIPQDGVDLLLVTSLKCTDGSDLNNFNRLAINNSTSDFSARTLRGVATTVSSQTRTDNAIGIPAPGSNANTTNTFSNNQFLFSNYTSNVAKSISSDSGVSIFGFATGSNYISATSWNNTAAITALKVYPDTQTFTAGSTASLYKIS